MGKVRGDDVVLSIFDAGVDDFVPFACARGITFDISREMIETSITNSGVFKTFIPGPGECSGTIDGLVFIQKDVTTNFDLGRMYDLLIAGTYVSIKYYETDIDGAYFLEKEVGAYFESITETASFDNISTFSATFKGVGLPTISYGDV